MTSYTDDYAFDDGEQQQEPSAQISRSLNQKGHHTAPQLVYSAHIPWEQAIQPQAAIRGSVVLVKSSRLAALSLRSSVNQDRALLVNALLSCTGLLNRVQVEEAQHATIEELRAYHDAHFLSALANYALFCQHLLAVYGLEDDCPPFPGLFEHVSLCAGGSLQAATALTARRARLAINFDGGRHHARRASASGFCYINDVVLAVLRLLDSFHRILYVDVDVHHGDAVEEAFEGTDRVLTVSMHRTDPGFFPGSGGLGAAGTGPGTGFALNLPLGEGLRDELFCAAFQKLAGGAASLFKPDCIVLQCGVDGLAGDPVAQSWNLTPKAFYNVGQQASSWNIPLLVLGGGGYDSASAACAWTCAVAGLLGHSDEIFNRDVPDHEYLDRYGPSYRIGQPRKPVLSPEMNDPGQVQAACGALLAQLGAAVARQRGGGGGVSGGTMQNEIDVVPAKRIRTAAGAVDV